MVILLMPPSALCWRAVLIPAQDDAAAHPVAFVHGRHRLVAAQAWAQTAVADGYDRGGDVRLHDLDEGSRPALPISPPACTCGEGPSTTLPPTPNLPLAVKARAPTHLRKSESAHPSVRPSPRSYTGPSPAYGSPSSSCGSRSSSPRASGGAGCGSFSSCCPWSCSATASYRSS